MMKGIIFPFKREHIPIRWHQILSSLISYVIWHLRCGYVHVCISIVPIHFMFFLKKHFFRCSEGIHE